MENPIKMDDLGVPLFSETSIWSFYEFSMVVHAAVSTCRTRRFLCRSSRKVPKEGVGKMGLGGLWPPNVGTS